MPALMKRRAHEAGQGAAKFLRKHPQVRLIVNPPQPFGTEVRVVSPRLTSELDGKNAPKTKQISNAFSFSAFSSFAS